MFTFRSTSRTILLLTAVAAALLLPSAALGQDTLLISYQGSLSDDAGDPVTGTPSMSFTIYDAGGVSQWSETHSSVQVNNGLFTVILGSQTALPGSVFNGDDRYLGISVEDGPELLPRALLTSSPSAANARQLVGDITTAPGLLQVYPLDDCVPPEPCAPALELIADAEIHSMKIYPPDPCTEAPCQPAFEVTTNADLELVTMSLQPPPDDNKPGVEMSVDAAASTALFRVGLPRPDDNNPSVQTTAATSYASLTLQGLDPAGGGSPPRIAMVTAAEGASLCVGTNTPNEALTVMGSGWFSGDVYVMTDTRVKQNIEPIGGALDKVSQMNGYYYDCRTDEFPELNMPQTRQIGFLASEVNEVVPEAVQKNAQGMTGVSYSRLAALLVEAVKELKAENDELRARLEALEGR